MDDIDKVVQSRDITLQRFTVTLVFVSALAAACFILFCFLRRTMRFFYAPRARDAKSSDTTQDSNSFDPVYKSDLLSWILDTWRYPETNIWNNHGLDAVFYLHMLKMFFIISVILGVGSLLVLLPINITGIGSVDMATGISRTTMGNIPPGDPALFAHVIFTYLFSIIILLIVWYLFRKFILRRASHLYSWHKKAFTVLVKEIPSKARGDREKLISYFEDHYSAKVIDIQIVYDTTELDQLLARRKELLVKKNARKKKNHKKESKNIKLLEEISGLEKEITALQEEDALLPSRVAFVTFDCPFPIDEKRFAYAYNEKMMVFPAPDPTDVYWPNLTMRRSQHWSRTILLELGIIVLSIVWSLPVLLIASLARITSFEKILPGLSSIANLNSIVQGFVEGTLPSLVLLILVVLAQPLVAKLVIWSGDHSKSLIEEDTMKHFFTFLIWNVLLLSSIGGAFFEIVGELFKDGLTEIVTLLAVALPKQSVFFVTYLLFASLGNVAINQLRIHHLIIRAIKLRFFCYTKEQIREANQPPTFDFAGNMAMDLLIFTGIVYNSIMSPLVIVFGPIYFGLNFLINKYNIVYVCRIDYRSHGNVWRATFNRVMFIVVLFQLTMIGVLCLTKFKEFYLLCPLPVLTVVVWVYLNKRLSRQAQYGEDPLGEGEYLLSRFDRQHDERGSRGNYRNEADRGDGDLPVYIQPGLRPLNGGDKEMGLRRSSPRSPSQGRSRNGGDPGAVGNGYVYSDSDDGSGFGSEDEEMRDGVQYDGFVGEREESQRRRYEEGRVSQSMDGSRMSSTSTGESYGSSSLSSSAPKAPMSPRGFGGSNFNSSMFGNPAYRASYDEDDFSARFNSRGEEKEIGNWKGNEDGSESGWER